MKKRKMDNTKNGNTVDVMLTKMNAMEKMMECFRNNPELEKLIANTNDEIINIVFQSRDYDQAKKLKGNRDVPLDNPLVKSIEENAICDPIIKNEKREVIDGQHRLDAYKKLGKPYPYIINVGLGLDEAQRLSNNTKPWKPMDWIDSNIDLGIDHYQIVKDFMKKYGFNRNETMIMLSGGKCKTADFNNKKMVVTNFEMADKVARNAIKITPMFGNGFKNRYFVLALYKIYKYYPNFSMEEFVQKIELTGRLKRRSSTGEYVELIEDIYNFHRHKNKIDMSKKR